MQFAQDAGLFVQQLDLPNDRALLVAMTQADYEAASFLDNRLIQAAQGQTQQRQMQWADWRAIESQSDEIRDDAQFIFHIGHVGSTLLARLLGASSDTLSLREPQLLRQFAELKELRGQAHSPWSAETFDARLELALKWLSRTFAPNQRALIKATSFASDIAPDLLKRQRKAMLLTLRPERYLQTILAGENSRAELSALSSNRLKRLHNRIGEAPFKLWELDEAQRAAMAWACEMTALEKVSGAKVSGEDVSWLDFDAFIAEPAQKLFDAAQFLGIAMSGGQANELVSGPLMQQYSKAPEHSYSPQLRENVLADAARNRANDIKAALKWLDDAGAQYSLIGNALDRTREG
ncbi:MAG: hypothetical protein ABJ239_10690 [Erythrobacter sp.]